MALTFDMTIDQLARQLSDAAMEQIQQKILDSLHSKADPIIEEAAREMAKLVKPVLTRMQRDPMSGEIHVTLLVNYEKHTDPSSAKG